MDIAERIRRDVRELLASDGWQPQLVTAVEAYLEAGRPRAAGWRDPIEQLGPEAIVERRRRAIARIKGGIGEWNYWAERVAALAQASTGWGATRSVVAALAIADLRGEPFAGSLDLAGFRFPGAVRFDDALFAGDLFLQGSRFLDIATFRGAKFSGDAFFDGSVLGSANFDGARFEKSGQFREVSFDGAVSFELTRFGKGAWFRGGTFAAQADFRQAEFVGDAAFGACVFRSEAAFAGTCFSGHAGFDRACFDGDVNFERAQFGSVAWFSDARFAAAPNFYAARFSGPAHFDRVLVPQGDNAVRRQLDDLRRRLAAG